MTNHHVGADTLAKLSTPQKNYHHDGFYAKALRGRGEGPGPRAERAGEHRGRDRAGQWGGEARHGRRAAPPRSAARPWPRIEKEATDKTGLRNDVVTLYQGGQYHLYSYKKYTDVRLVFAPEFDIAFFGGDPDNFEYPRYDLDVCFFRAYEDDKPAKIEHFLEWSPDGSQDGELVFVAGHPGRTDRLNTVASLEHLRDDRMPFLLDYLKKKEALLLAFGRTSAEADRQSREELFSIQNSRKARVGGLEGLRDADFMKRKAEAEAELRDRIKAAGKPGDPLATAWDRIAEAQKTAARILVPYALLERGWAFDSTLFVIARDLVRLAEERAKPNAERLKEYRESNLKSLELALFSAGADLSRVRGDQARPLAGRVEAGHARRSAGGASAPRPYARRSRPGLHPGHEAGRRRVPSQAGRGRHEGHPGLRRPDDQAGPRRRRRRPSGPQDPGGPGRGGRDGQLRARSPGRSSRRRAMPSTRMPRSRSGWPSGSPRATRSTARRSRPTRRSAAPSSMPRPTAIRRPTNCPGAGSRPASRGACGSRPRSTSSPPPTSSAATRGVRSSTAATRSSA